MSNTFSVNKTKQNRKFFFIHRVNIHCFKRDKWYQSSTLVADFPKKKRNNFVFPYVHISGIERYNHLQRIVMVCKAA